MLDLTVRGERGETAERDEDEEDEAAGESRDGDKDGAAAGAANFPPQLERKCVRCEKS